MLVDKINKALSGLGGIAYIDVPENLVIEDSEGNEIPAKVVGRLYNAYPIDKSESGGLRINMVIVNLFVSNTYEGNLLSRDEQYAILKECEARLYALNIGFEARYMGIDTITQDARLDLEVQYYEQNLLKEPRND